MIKILTIYKIFKTNEILLLLPLDCQSKGKILLCHFKNFNIWIAGNFSTAHTSANDNAEICQGRWVLFGQ